MVSEGWGYKIYTLGAGTLSERRRPRWHEIFSQLDQQRSLAQAQMRRESCGVGRRRVPTELSRLLLRLAGARFHVIFGASVALRDPAPTRLTCSGRVFGVNLYFAGYQVRIAVCGGLDLEYG